METPQWLVVNKPGGLLVERSLYDFPSVEVEVENYLKAQSMRPFVGIVHRLDRAVSGVLLVAKKKQALKLLNEQFRDRKVKKRYWALVENAPPQAQGLLSGWLLKDQLQKKAFIFEQQRTGTLACSLEYKSLGQKSGLTWLEIDLHTGKFHQIRAQLAAIHCPIAGDEKYGATSSSYARDAIALHARSLGFFDPSTGKWVEAVAEPPKGWEGY